MKDSSLHPQIKFTQLLSGLPKSHHLYFSNPHVDQEKISFLLRDSHLNGTPVGKLTLLRGFQEPNYFRQVSNSFTVYIENFTPDPNVSRVLVRAGKQVMINDHGGFSGIVTSEINSNNSLNSSSLGIWFMVALLVVWGGYLARKAMQSAKALFFVKEFRLSHALPVAIQASLFLYWALYWPGVTLHLPSLFAQIALAFALDFCLSLYYNGRWRITLAPLPIVLSINLFAWFSGWFFISLTIFVAIISKVWLKRNGHHIFNPSAFALTIGGLLCLLVPSYFSYTGLFHPMNLAPNMSELIILLTVVPLLRFQITPIPISIILSYLLFSWGNGPVLSQGPMLVAVTLLATDPQTSPKRLLGQILYGLIIGFGISFFSRLMLLMGVPDEFAKVFPIPIVNVFAGNLDKISKLLGWERMEESFSSNMAYVAIWIFLISPFLIVQKKNRFEAALHWDYRTPLISFAPHGCPECSHNAVFCQAFSFPMEVSAWRKYQESWGPIGQLGRDVYGVYIEELRFWRGIDFFLARLYQGLGDSSKAIEILEKQYQRTPSVKIGLALADIYGKMKNYSGQAEVLTKLHKQYSEDQVVEYRLALNYQNVGEYSQAISILSDLCKKFPSDAQYRNDLGVCLFLDKHYREAHHEFNKAIQANPRYLPSYLSLAALYETRGDSVAAISVYKDAVSHCSPKDPLMYMVPLDLRQ